MAGWSVLVLLFLMGVLLTIVKKLKSDLLVCLCVVNLSCWSLFFASSCSLSQFSSFILMAFNMSSTFLSTCASTLSLSLVVSIFMPSGVNLGTGKSPLFVIFLSSFSMLKSFITSSTWHRMSAMYGPYSLLLYPDSESIQNVK